jgi:hypothetical protein
MGLLSSIYNKILIKGIYAGAGVYGVLSYLFSPDGYRSSPTKRLKRLPLSAATANPQHQLQSRPICLFAAYASDVTLSAFYYLKFLSDLGFAIVYINNAVTSRESCRVLSDLVWMAFDRPNIGQDVGTYKDGIMWLEANGYFQGCPFLAIVNDSMQFIPGAYADNLATRVRTFLRSDSPALFSHISQQVLPHYQSFFQILKPEVFLSRPFLEFWKSYVPYSHRQHCINNGEIKVSQKVYSLLSGVTVLYTSEELHRQLLHNFDRDGGIVAEDLLYLMPSPYRTIIKKVTNPALSQLLNARGERQALLRSELMCVSDLIENSNPTHVAAFLYPVFLFCPLLKRDICFAGSFTIAQAVNLYREMLDNSLGEQVDLGEIRNQLHLEYQNYLYKKGVPLGYANRKVAALLKGLGGGFVYSGTYSG